MRLPSLFADWAASGQSPVVTPSLPWVLIIVGTVATLAGLFLLRQKSCDDLHRLWQDAQSRYETCAEELTKAEAWLREKNAERVMLEGATAETLATTTAQIEQLRRSETIGVEMVANWRVRTGEAAAQAERARAAFEACTSRRG